jgi:hypothetical protein
MLDVFRRMDDSAKDVNEFKSENNLIFHNTMILEASATAPSEEIQGFFSADVIIEVKYSRVTGPDGRFI